MIQSMTGYGNVVVSYKDKKIHVEIKSLNSKQLERWNAGRWWQRL